jgi:hypothetical protein
MMMIMILINVLFVMFRPARAFNIYIAGISSIVISSLIMSFSMLLVESKSVRPHLSKLIIIAHLFSSLRRLWVLRPAHRRKVQTQHDGRHTVLDGARSCQTKRIWYKS